MCFPFQKFGLILCLITILSGGVIGNTSDFGSEESRFEPWPDNILKKSSRRLMIQRSTFLLLASSVCWASPAARLCAEPAEAADPRLTDTAMYDQEREQRSLELENALRRARQEKELAALYADIERLRLEKEALALRWELEQEKATQAYRKELLALRQQREKIVAEVELAQAKLAQVLEKFNLTSAEQRNQVALLKVEAEQLVAEVAQAKAKKERDKYADSVPVYATDPLQKDGTLVLSDRSVSLQGVITPWKADYVVDKIQYFNNKDKEPIFIVIESSPGGSIMAGWRIMKAMQNSQAPVYVVVKSFAASMAACLTTLATRSYAYPNAVILHHQPWMFVWGGFNVREQKELYEEMKKWWQRLGGPLAKKMGISVQKLDKKFYEKSVRGDWTEFADDARKLKWVDHIISGIRDTGVRQMPETEGYSWRNYYEEYYGSSEAMQGGVKDPVVYLPPLSSKDFYFLYNPNDLYRIRPMS